MFHGFVVVMLLGFFVQQLWLISILRKIAMSTTPGLTALQALVTTVQNFASQQSSDLAALTASINAAITALQNSSASEDPAVLAAVQNLNTALATVQANESNLETLNTNLTAAETPAPAPSVGGGVAQAVTPAATAKVTANTPGSAGKKA